jgi:hypothetical protein
MDKIIITLFIIIGGIIMIFGTSFLNDDIPKPSKEVSEEVLEKESSVKKTEDTITDSTIIFGFIIGLGLIAYFNVIRPKYGKKILNY